mgnify:CR=1 FL=1
MFEILFKVCYNRSETKSNVYSKRLIQAMKAEFQEKFRNG